MLSDEADARIKFAWMTLDLGDDTARLRPAPRLIVEIREGSSQLVRRSPDRAREKIADAFLQDAIGGQPDGVFDPSAFEILIDLGIGEAGAGAEIDARERAAIARHDRLEHALPAIGESLKQTPATWNGKSKFNEGRYNGQEQ